MNKFDFVCLLETFVEDLKTNVFYNFIQQVADLVASYLSLKKTLADYVQEIALGVENIITMKLSRRLFGISTAVFSHLCLLSPPKVTAVFKIKF